MGDVQAGQGVCRAENKGWAYQTPANDKTNASPPITPNKNLPSEISITSPIDMVPKMRFIVASDSGLGTMADSGFPPACAGVVKVDDAPVAA